MAESFRSHTRSHKCNKGAATKPRAAPQNAFTLKAAPLLLPLHDASLRAQRGGAVGGWLGPAAAAWVVTHVLPPRLGLQYRARAFWLAHGDVTRLPAVSDSQ